jgi:hypothetical protein
VREKGGRERQEGERERREREKGGRERKEGGREKGGRERERREREGGFSRERGRGREKVWTEKREIFRKSASSCQLQSRNCFDTHGLERKKREFPFFPHNKILSIVLVRKL